MDMSIRTILSLAFLTSTVRGRSPAFPPPSSPPVVEHDNPVDQHNSLSPQRTLAQANHLLSPETARIPPPGTPASRSKTRDTSSEYYTAAWGSPYERSPSSRSARTALSEQAHSEGLSGSSPGPDFGLEHLVPSRLGDLSLPQPGLSPLARLTASAQNESEDSEVTPRSRTKRWVQLPRKEESLEKVRWWSDESAHSTSDRVQKGKRRRKASSGSLKELSEKPTFGHKSRESNRTLDQQSFWANIRDQRISNMSSLFASRWADTPPAEEDGVEQSVQKLAESGMYASRWADTPPVPETAGEENGGVESREQDANQSGGDDLVEETIGSDQSVEEENSPETSMERSRGLDEANEGTKESETSAVEKATSEPHVKELTSQDASHTNTDKQSSEFSMDEAVKSAMLVDEGASMVPTSPSKSRLGVPRPKKKVGWKGKTCVIQIPDLDYGALGFDMPMSLDEARERLKRFEELGFDINGFALSSEPGVKPIFPDEAEARATSIQEGTTVSLPDLNKWRAYETWLTEQKLAALGVSLGGDEPATGGAQEMSRQSSGQYPPLPFSPPIPSNSTNSLGRPGIVRGHSHAMSVASPISPLNGPYGHMHRHSTFTGPLGFPQVLQIGQQPLVPGMRSFSPQRQQHVQQTSNPSVQSFSPQTQFPIPGFNRAGSPAHLATLRNDISAVRSPGSPLSQQILARSPQAFNRGPGEDQVRNQQGYFQSFPQPRTPNTFVSHGSNIHVDPVLPELPEEDDEEELENEPETGLQTQPEPPAYLPPHKRAQINANIAVPTPRGHRHNISEGLERDILQAEHRHIADRRDWIEVDESSEEKQTADEGGQSGRSELESSRPGPVMEKDPLSQDDVVQETSHRHKTSGSRFNVAAPAFQFNPAASFEPASTAFTFGEKRPKLNGQPSSGHDRQKSSGAFNVAAPVFKPTGGSAAGSDLLQKSEFSFSRSGPSFKPNAPSFEPPKQQERTIIDELPSIFGKVDIPEIVRPARRSKAVAIVRPDESSRRSVGGSGTEFEDEDGRPVQNEDRLKRQRKAGGDGDEVPRFAEPTPMPAPIERVLQSDREETEQQRPSSATHTVQADFDNETLEKLDNVPADVLDVAPPDSLSSDEPQVPATLFNHKPSSSLSALAKPFAPLSGSDAENIPPHQPKESITSISELEEGELKESSNPPTSPLEDREPSLSSDEIERAVTPTLREVRLEFDEPPSARFDHVGQAEPSYDEIDAVMRQLNEMDEDKNVINVADISPLSTPGARSVPSVTYPPKWSRSDAPSPSPRRRQAPLNPQGESSFTVHDRTDSEDPLMNGWPQPTRIGKVEDAPTSDWSGVFSAHDEEKIEHRGLFFDSHIEELIGRAVERRLQPLEDSLRDIQSNFNKRPISRDLAPKRSSSAVESDADDEDELSEEQRHRPISRGRDKRIDQIKAAVLEALREQSPHRPSQSLHDVQELHSVLHDMKMSFARAASAGLELDDIRAVVEEVVIKQQSQAFVPIAIDEDAKENTHKREMSELEGRMNETLAGALEEANLRRAVEEREAETKRMLRLAEEELELRRESARDGDSRLNAAEHEREDLLNRLEDTEEAQRHMEDQVKNLEAENIAMNATLEEYRMSSHQWRQDIDQATREREDLENTIAGLGRDLEVSHELGSSMRRRLEKLHFDMASAAGQLSSEKALWKAKLQEYRSKCEQLEAQNSAHLSERSEFDEELRGLRASASEASEARIALDQMKTSNACLDDMVRKLQIDLVEQQTLAARYERDFNDAREAGRAEVQRTRISMETDIEAANHQVNMVRVELESELAKMRAELENVRGEAEDTKARHERVLEEEDNVRRETLRKVNHASSVALDETRQKHETSLQELQSAHNRALQHALEDKHRSEHFLNERLALSDAKLQHFQDKVIHLEERLEVAKSAAQAAVMNAQSKTAAAPLAALPEKVSPQALRESILVLQEQLHERESHIDQLQHQLDQEGPAELKKRDDEIAWLRELLGERGDELTELINALAQPAFDRARVRDTAIRIRANLQMEQQEKERFGQNSQTLPGQAIASLSNFAAPKAVQLTSAFNKWRSTMESSTLRNAPRANVGPQSNTPSKARNSGSFSMPRDYRYGLMTPPASNLRSTPSPEAIGSLPAPRLHSRSGKETQASKTEPPKLGSRHPSASSDAPTARFLRSQSYDNDAEDTGVHMQSFEEDEDLDIADNKPPAFRSLEDELDTAVENDSVA